MTESTAAPRHGSIPHQLATDARDRAALAWDRHHYAVAARLDAYALGYTVAAEMAFYARSSARRRRLAQRRLASAPLVAVAAV